MLNSKLGSSLRLLSSASFSGDVEEFVEYLECVKSLRFTDKPDYSDYRRLFRDLFVREGFEYDLVYDWTIKV